MTDELVGPVHRLQLRRILNPNMRLFGRNDIVLLGGLAVALFVLFNRPLQEMFDFVRELEDTYNVRLLPALKAAVIERVAEVTPRSQPRTLEAEPALGAVRLALAEARGGARLPVYI